MSLEGKVKVRGFRTRLRRVNKEIVRNVAAAWKAMAPKVRRDFVRKALTGRPGLMRRTGALASSAKSEVTGRTLDTLRFILSFGKKGKARRYATTHAQRGQQKFEVITARRRKYLAIPISRLSGGSRQTSPRGHGPFSLKKTAGGIYLASRSGGENFLLKPRVRIPKRVNVKAFLEKYRPKLVKAASKAAAKVKI